MSNSSYLEGTAGSWLMYSRDKGLLFDNRFLTRQLALVSSTALISALTGKLPLIFGYSSSILDTLSRAPALFLPGYYLWQAWQQLQTDENQSSHHIVIADNRSLAERLTIEVQRARKAQKLTFKMPPVNLAGLPADGLKATMPLARLARLMTAMNSDYVEISWLGKRTSLQLAIGRNGTQIAALEVPEWGKSLTHIAQEQRPPAIMAFLQPAGIQALTSLLNCLKENHFGKDSCASGVLRPEAEGLRISYYRFQPKDEFNNLQILSGKVLGHRYLLPLPPCQVKNQCAMAMAWSMETTSGQHIPNHLPTPSTPLMLYTRPKALLDIPKRLTPPVPPMMGSVQPWQTDIITLLPYAAVYFIANKLLATGLERIGCTSTSLTGGGVSLLSALGLGMSTATSNWDDYSSDNATSARGSQDTHPRWKPHKPSYAAPSFAVLETEMINAIDSLGSAAPQSGLYQLEHTTEQTLPHYGNNCFFNSTLAYLSNSLTETELTAISKDQYLSAGHIQNMHRTQRACYQELRDAFVELMTSLKQQTTSQQNAQQQRVFRAVQKYAKQFSHEYQFAANLMAGQSMAQLGQQDAGEFLMVLTAALGLNRNPASSVASGTTLEFHLDGETGRKSTVSPHDRHKVLTIGLPRQEHITENTITSFDRLLNNHHLRKEWIGELSNALYVSPKEAREMGLKNPALLQYGASLPFFKQDILVHDNAKQLQHLDIHPDIYSNHIKIRYFTRRLLEGGGTINVPVYSSSTHKTSTVHMEIDTMILHTGQSLYSGHYVTAIRRGKNWYIYDDMAPYVTKLQSGSRFWGPSSLQIINSYMEDKGLDPYILHFRR